MKKIWGRWVWLAVGAVVIVLIFYNLSRNPEWRNFRWDHLWRSIVGASLGYLLLAVSSFTVSFFVRAVRWRFFMRAHQGCILMGFVCRADPGLQLHFPGGPSGRTRSSRLHRQKRKCSHERHDRGLAARAGA